MCFQDSSRKISMTSLVILHRFLRYRSEKNDRKTEVETRYTYDCSWRWYGQRTKKGQRTEAWMGCRRCSAVITMQMLVPEESRRDMPAFTWRRLRYVRYGPPRPAWPTKSSTLESPQKQRNDIYAHARAYHAQSCSSVAISIPLLCETGGQPLPRGTRHVRRHYYLSRKLLKTVKQQQKRLANLKS